MVRLNNDEQFKFLISCIRYSNNGKVDFQEVANECGIVSKGAAAKRYERMMKAHGIYQPTNTSRDTAVPPMRKQGNQSDSDTTGKKRKMEIVEEDIVKDPVRKKNKKPIKSEPEDKELPEDTPIKEEPAVGYENSWSSYNTSSLSGNPERSNFDEFLEGSTFETINTTRSRPAAAQEQPSVCGQQELMTSNAEEVKELVE